MVFIRPEPSPMLNPLPGYDIDPGGRSTGGYSQPSSAPSSRVPVPSPFPGRKPPVYTPPIQQQPQRASRSSRSSSEGVDEGALRSITDDSGGRTEIVTSARDLDAATSAIADELSKQYFLGYAPSAPKDGRWHTIEVRLKRGNYHVRARRGYVAG